MINRMKKVFFIFAACLCFYAGLSQEISLSGKWKVSLGSIDAEKYVINLPGSLDDAGIGTANTIEPALNIGTMAHLARKVQYTGKAYYSNTFTVPVSWKSKQIKLILGRVLWRSALWIDGKQLPNNGESLVSAHEFDITDYAIAGKKQTITICIDNSNIYPGINIYATQYPSVESSEMAHAYTNHTQIKWNGILGNISLVAKSKLSINKVDVFTDLQTKKMNIRYWLNDEKANKISIHSFVRDPKTGKQWADEFNQDQVDKKVVTGTIPFGNDPIYWSEFSPRLYQLVTIIKSDYGIDTITTPFGIRELETKEGNLYLNDHRIFIRGNLECVIFPLKGYPPMLLKEWKAIFKTAKDYGLNTFRFHSWCPPEAAFTAADELGFFLQVELPHWNLKVGTDTATFDFLHREADRILDAYGNHPSFLFFSMGNELEGDFNKLNGLVAELKEKDKRHFYSTTTFTFQKEITGTPQPQDDFYVTQWTKKGWVRGQVVFNDQSPDFSKDYSNSIDGITVPIISHEIGQYSVFPDISEIGKYTGNLVPKNFIAIRNDMEKKGLLKLAPAYLAASGKFASLLYKEEIERALKTKGFDGFQLLQMQDFPGQGTALVGMLNAFWQSKGFLYAKEFRKYCSGLTPLLRYPKAVYTNNEIFAADVELANFYKPLKAAELVYKIKDERGVVLKTGSFGKKDYAIDNGLVVGKISFGLTGIKSATKITVEVSVKGTSYSNDWNIWVYPSSLKEDNGNVIVTGSLQAALDALENGRKVLLCPNPDTLNGIAGKFVPVFWSPVHFPDQPGTMGLLIQSKHKALSNFPTDSFSNWQWWDLAVKSKALLAKDLPGEANIVRPIDNFMRNQDLTSLFEARVAKGQLIFCSIDIMTDLKNRPQAKQLRYSLLQYMNSNHFHPDAKFRKENIMAYFK